MAAAEQLGKPRVRAQPAVEVGTQRAEHDHPAFVVARGGREPLEELAPLGLLLADRKQLLELVDGDHHSDLVAGAGQHVPKVPAERAPELVARVLSSSQQHLAPPRAARQRAGPERRQYTRAQQR